MEGYLKDLKYSEQTSASLVQKRAQTFFRSVPDSQITGIGKRQSERAQT